jgi:cobalamin synthase
MVTGELKNLLSFLTVFPVRMDKDMLNEITRMVRVIVLLAVAAWE